MARIEKTAEQRVVSDVGETEPLSTTFEVKKEAPQRVMVKETRSIKRKILFQYRNSKPQQVALEGDFTRAAVPMVKGENYTWSVYVEITPGEYMYNFIVNGKSIADPNNPHVRMLPGNQKKSLLIVKPLE
jgi:hypothetical protein